MEQLPINSQWKSFARHCAQYAKQSIVAELNCGAVMYWTQSTMAFLNVVFLSSTVSEEVDLHRRLEAIKAYVAKVQPTFRWQFVIEPELLPADIRERSRQICLAAQFVHVADVKCMQTTSLLLSVRPLPAAKISFAASQQDVYDALLLNVQAHDIDTSVAKNVTENNAFVINFDKELCCIVSVDGKPVATATTLLLDECLYVAFVATSAQHRKHGYAEVAMHTSIERALKTLPHRKHGIVLHATELGRPVYERIGFKDISHVEVYIHKPDTSI